MNMGVDRLAQQAPQDLGEADWTAAPSPTSDFTPDYEAHEAPPRGNPVLAVVLILLGLAWVGISGFAFVDAGMPVTLPEIVARIGVLAGPLAVLLLAWLAFGRTSRRETETFVRAVDRMRTEAESLDRVLALVGERLASNREQVSEEAGRLMKLGEEASDRLGRVTHYLAREGSDLERRAQSLEAAASQARVDFGVLLADLPQAEQAAKSFSDTMRESGVAAHERAVALEAQLSALSVRAQEVDHNTGGAAERLGAHIARIDTSAGVAAERLDEVTSRLGMSIDQSLARASDAVDATRVAIDAQAQNLHASIEQGRARFLDAGAEASQLLSDRLDEAKARVDAIDAGIAAQEQATTALITGLDAHVERLDMRIRTFSEAGSQHGARLEHSLQSLSAVTDVLQNRIAAGDDLAGRLIDRAAAMAEAADLVGERFSEALPPLIDGTEAQVHRLREAAEAANAPVAGLQDQAGEAARQLAEAEASIARQQTALQALLDGITASIGGIEEQMRALTQAANDADAASSQIVSETGPELVESLVRVREAARVASNHARDAIGAAIPESAANLAEAAQAAVAAAVGDSIRGQIDELESASQRAAIAARIASERVTRQLLSLGESAAALEGKIEDERAAREEHEHGSLSHRVALLVEALNSTAIDVAKILSNEVTDRAWAAYLKGDRGVFTRRAVRLLDSGEARVVAQHYETEPEFREQVNRYIHDFEQMLRRVLSDREGESLSVTLLSSDMGKLYVALAQAIERFR